MESRVRVKICGVTNLADLREVAKAGADAVGFNFYPPSPRSITFEMARELLERMPPFVEAVGVFVRQRLSSLLEEVTPLGRLWTVQIHGMEPELSSAWPLCYIPAFQVKDRADVERLRAYLKEAESEESLPGAVLVDGHATGLVGGTGKTAPWELLEGLDLAVPLILAGGLTPHNVGEAIRRVRPWAVDTASGVESEPGKKDVEKVRRFIDAVRDAESR